MTVIMKRISMFTIFIILTLSVLAQSKMADKAQIQQFFKSKTYIVLEANLFMLYNPTIKDQVGKHWKITPFEVITQKEFERLKRDPLSSFLFLSTARMSQEKNMFNTIAGWFSGGKDESSYLILNLVMGVKSGKLNDMPDLGSVPLAMEGAGEEFYLFKIGGVLKMMQQIVLKLKENPEPDMKKMALENLPKIKTMDLWVIKSQLTPSLQSETAFKKLYPYSFKFVTADEIEEAVNQSKNILFLHKIGPEEAEITEEAFCTKFILSAADGQLLWVSRHKVSKKKPDAMLEEDLREMIK